MFRPEPDNVGERAKIIPQAEQESQEREQGIQPRRDSQSVPRQVSLNPSKTHEAIIRS